MKVTFHDGTKITGLNVYGCLFFGALAALGAWSGFGYEPRAAMWLGLKVSGWLLAASCAWVLGMAFAYGWFRR
jgi:hypothetical protein